MAVASSLILFGCGDNLSGPTPSTFGPLPPVDIIGVATLDDNPSCADLDLGTFAFKDDDPTSGTFDIDGVNQVTWSIDGVYVDWTATLGIDAVIVKGGPGASLYEHAPETLGGEGLHAPINPNTERPYDISHIELCFDYEVAVTKTADTSFTRDWDWSITKTGSDSELSLAVGQRYQVDYTVVVTPEAHADSDFAVAGAITISNPAPIAATVIEVIDTLGDVAVEVNCGAELPVILEPGGSLVCAYAVDLDGAAGETNQVFVVTAGDVGSGRTTAAVDFEAADVTEIDGCVDVVDREYGPLGTACADDGAATFEYSMMIGYDSCGEFDFVNLAKYRSPECEEGRDAWTVHTVVECVPTGCALTPGYWKTHSAFGPAPYDNTWEQLADGANTPFFLSGDSWHGVLWTESTNDYYILARAFAATYLNGLNGADLAPINSELTAAAELLGAHPPADIAALTGDDPLRASLIALAASLDEYNNGEAEVPHCDEDDLSAE